MFVLSRAIEKSLVPWNELDWPLDWPGLFGREHPLRLELGFGNGEYLERMAKEQPEINWVGAELSWFSVVRLLKRIERSGLENARVLHGDGAYLLQKLFAPESLDEVVLNHSDPWPKKRHWSRRLVQPRLLELLGDRLRPGGRALILTDHQEYADWITGVLEGQEILQSEFSTPWVDHLPDHAGTKYKRKGLEAGAIIHHFVWTKTGPTTGKPEPEKVGTMTNILLEGDFQFSNLLAGLSNRTVHEAHHDEPVVIQFGAPYLRDDDQEWVVDVRIKEGSYAQHLLLSASRREPGRLLLKPTTVGSPRPTWGLRRALWHLATHLLQTQPGLAVHSSGVEGLTGKTGLPSV